MSINESIEIELVRLVIVGKVKIGDLGYRLGIGKVGVCDVVVLGCWCVVGSFKENEESK